uniref:Uncharacterized protein n=1 Tax=Crouania attenuata TaxID=42002 RepID=A0A4D6WSF6_9FLOR|nr:hypothetical protein [Crouania attenuata]
MKFNNYSKNITNTWISKQNIYNLNNKTIDNYQYICEIIDLDLNAWNENYLIKYTNYKQYNISSIIKSKKKSSISYGIIKKKMMKQIHTYDFYKRVNFSLKLKILDNNLCHIEYLYSINENLYVSIAFIKENKTQKYIGIAFTSYIKQIIKP